MGVTETQRCIPVDRGHVRPTTALKTKRKREKGMGKVLKSESSLIWLDYFWSFCPTRSNLGTVNSWRICQESWFCFKSQRPQNNRRHTLSLPSLHIYSRQRMISDRLNTLKTMFSQHGNHVCENKHIQLFASTYITCTYLMEKSYISARASQQCMHLFWTGSRHLTQ